MLCVSFEDNFSKYLFKISYKNDINPNTLEEFLKLKSAHFNTQQERRKGNKERESYGFT